MGISRKVWTTPRLVVLARTKSEEAVLSAGKLVYTAGGTGGGPLQVVNGCYLDLGPGCSGRSSPASS